MTEESNAKFDRLLRAMLHVPPKGGQKTGKAEGTSGVEPSAGSSETRTHQDKFRDDVANTKRKSR